MVYTSRNDKFKKLFPLEPDFRWRQIQAALFKPEIGGWAELSTLPLAMRRTLADDIPWLALRQNALQESRDGSTKKALLELSDGLMVETVLMANRRGQFTVCLSTQVGCSVGCRFCATGKMGLTRSLEAEEIIDQFRFWQHYLNGIKSPARISNLVLMGMGEPLLNYEAVKDALNIILDNTDIGKTRITVSTVGIFPLLDRLLADADWPEVRLAISLHSADLKIRQMIIPNTPDDFFARLTDWSKRYLKKYGNRRHHLSFEYIMISGLNDSAAEAEKLAKLVNRIGQVKVNLIPCNLIGNKAYQGSDNNSLAKFQALLNKRGVIATVRKSMGGDIAAACGQLAGQTK